MVRYYDFIPGSTFNLDFPTRADFTKSKEYFEDFVLGGGRDLKAYGLVHITPNLTTAYDVNGLNFLKLVLGHDTLTSESTLTTVTPQSTIPEVDYRVRVDADSMSIHDAKVDTWEITIEEGSPVRGEFTVIGKTIGTEAASAFSPDFEHMPILPHQFTLTVGGETNTSWTRIALRISNALDPIFKTSSVPVDIREAGMDITGRIRAPEYGEEWANEGSMDLLSEIGTIILHNVKFTEVPPRVTGFDLPETEIAFTAYPTANTCAITAKIPANPKW